MKESCSFMPKLHFSDILKRVYSIDDFDYNLIEHGNESKICPLCNKSFYPLGKNAWRQRYCNRSHYIDCAVCGKPVLQVNPTTNPGGLKATCKGECEKKFRAKQTQATIESKYGVSNISQSPEFKDKISRGLKAKSKETTEKARETLIRKYGGMGTASPTIRAKIEKTTEERYGVKNATKSLEIRKKLSDICSSPEYQSKYTATALANWGVDRPSKTAEIKDKMKATSLERYGVECTLQTDYAKERFKQACLDKYGVPNVLQSEYGMQRAREGFIAHIHDHNSKISKVNQDVAKYMSDNFGIQTEFEFMIGRKSYDLKVVGKNIVVEIDPSYTHSDLPNHWSEEGLPIEYHESKTEAALQNGYRCIHIFDWDDIDKVCKLLSSTRTIYARKCKVADLPVSVAERFVAQYHIQGSARGSIKCYGLFEGDNLVEVMTFGKPRYNRNYQWELLRLCTQSGIVVIGGASKLFKRFVNEVDPESVISYCDRAKFKGDVYEKMGMNLHHISPPAKIWSKGSEYVTDNLLRQRGYDQLFNASYGKGTSNEVLMVENGWRSVYDCGQFVFEYKKF